LNFFVKPFLSSDDETIELRWQYYHERYIRAKLSDIMPYNYSEIQKMPIKVQDFIFKKIDEISEKRAKILKG